MRGFQTCGKLFLLKTSFPVYLGTSLDSNQMRFPPINPTNQESITVEDQTIEEVQKFAYLGATVGKEGGGMEDLKNRLSACQKQEVYSWGLRKYGDLGAYQEEPN